MKGIKEKRKKQFKSSCFKKYDRIEIKKQKQELLLSPPTFARNEF